MADYGYEDFTIEQEPLRFNDYLNIFREAASNTLHRDTIGAQKRAANQLKRKGLYEILSSPIGKHTGILGALNSDVLNTMVTGGKYANPAMTFGIPAAYSFVKNLRDSYNMRTKPVTIENYRQTPGGPAGMRLNETSGNFNKNQRPVRSPHL
tara:strand:- start:24 stop:479 length:456 start_codon:yes stop_codon:yes gene_type:complete